MLTIVITAVVGLGLGLIIARNSNSCSGAFLAVYLAYSAGVFAGFLISTRIGHNQPMTDWTVVNHSKLLPLNEIIPEIQVVPKTGFPSGFKFLMQGSDGSLQYGKVLDNLEQFKILEDQPNGSAHLEHTEKRVARFSRWGIGQSARTESLKEIHIPNGGLLRKPLQ